MHGSEIQTSKKTEKKNTHTHKKKEAKQNDIKDGRLSRNSVRPEGGSIASTVGIDYTYNDEKSNKKNKKKWLSKPLQQQRPQRPQRQPIKDPNPSMFSIQSDFTIQTINDPTINDDSASMYGDGTGGGGGGGGSTTVNTQQRKLPPSDFNSHISNYQIKQKPLPQPPPRRPKT